MSQPKAEATEIDDLSWLAPPQTGNRYIRKAKENPFVPIGEREPV